MLQVVLCALAILHGAQSQTRNSTWEDYTTSSWPAQGPVGPMGPRGQRPPTILIAMAWLRKLLTTIIIPVFGLFGNTMTTVLLLKSKLRSHPTSVFMLTLSIADSLCLISAIFMIIIPVSWFGMLRKGDAMCKISEYIMRTSGETSSWVLACMSVERSLAISMPLRSRSFLSRTKNKIAVIGCTATVGAYFTYALVLYAESPRGGCLFHYNAYFTVWVRYVMDYGVFILLPGITILVANVIIITALVRTRGKFLSEGQSKRDSATSSMIAMLIATSVAYLVLKTPYHLYIILVPIGGEQGRTVASAVIDWAAIGHGLVGAAQLMNHGINFYLYVITGREFRKALRNLLCRGSKKNYLELSTMKTVSSTMN